MKMQGKTPRGSKHFNVSPVSSKKSGEDANPEGTTQFTLSTCKEKQEGKSKLLIRGDQDTTDTLSIFVVRLLESASPYSSPNSDGTYTFEFSRPLRTMDRLQQDVQFVIGEEHKFSAAFWYPVNGNPWTASGHYSVNCDWVTLKIIPAVKESRALSSARDFNSLNVISLILSLAAFGASLFIGWT
ncbi:hypothetical protein KI387_043592, partial [Taxus chinensis]